jgi:hypothetical protein
LIYRKGLVIPGSSQPGEDILHMSTNAAVNNNENIRHFNPQQHLHPNQQLSPESSPNSNPQLWSMYNNNNNNSNALYNRCIIGLNQLRLNEFSGFLEKRRDPEIVNF